MNLDSSSDDSRRNVGMDQLLCHLRASVLSVVIFLRIPITGL